MLSLDLTGVDRILCLGAHADDIEIGAGGTLCALLERAADVQVVWAVASAPGVRADEARASAIEYVGEHRSPSVRIGEFRESFFPDQWGEIKEWVEGLRRDFEPDLVFTHYRHDRHQDHRVLSDLAWNTFRDHFILEYEILKYDGDLGVPNTFFPLSAGVAQKKIERLMKHFRSQARRHWFTPDSFAALHRLRGIECASPTGLAEAFHGRKLRLTPPP